MATTPAQTFYTDSFATGLVGSIHYAVLTSPGNVTVVARTTTGITETEAGSGIYQVTVAAGTLDPTQQYAVIWDNGSGQFAPSIFGPVPTLTVAGLPSNCTVSGQVVASPGGTGTSTVTVTLTISGVVPAAAVLSVLTRSDNGQTPSGVTLPQNFTASTTGTTTTETFVFADVDVPPAYNFSGTLYWTDGSNTPFASSEDVAPPAISAEFNVAIGLPTGPQTTDVFVITGAAPLFIWNVTDTDGNPINLAGRTLTWTAFTDDGLGNQVSEVQYSTTGGSITISGAGSNAVTVQFAAADWDAGTPQGMRMILQDASRNQGLAIGVVQVDYVTAAAPS